MSMPWRRGWVAQNIAARAPQPAGGGTWDFTPSDWQILLRSSGLTGSGGVVTGWANDGSLGSSMSVTGSPTYLSNAVNGLPGAQFTYANGLSSAAPLTLGGGSGQQSFVVVFAVDSYSDSPVLINHGLTANDGLTLSIANSGSGTPQRIEGLGDGYFGGAPPPAVLSASNAITGSGWHILRVDLGTSLLIELDGLALTPATTATGATPSFAATFQVGGQSYFRTVAVVAGLDVGDTLLDKAVGKLAWDAGITLDVSHPYSGARP